MDATSYGHATALVCYWAENKLSRYVCVATVNNVMEGYDSADFKAVTNGADLVTPDGMPLVWGLKALGLNASRVYGPDLTPQILGAAAERGLGVGFYGSSEDVLDRLVRYAKQNFPNIVITYKCSPPFRALTPQEDAAVVASINASGTAILFIGLSTPKQDYWMASHRSKVGAVMVGVGAAFDFLTGAKPQAPRWMMSVGLEWFFRLVSEPRRLWKRYLKHNPRFAFLFAAQLVRRIIGGAHDE